MLQEQLEWVIKYPPPHPCLRLSMKIDTQSYRDQSEKPHQSPVPAPMQPPPPTQGPAPVTVDTESQQEAPDPTVNLSLATPTVSQC